MLDQVVTEVHGYRPPATVSTPGSLVASTPIKKESTSEVAAMMVDENLSARARLQMRETLSPIASRVEFAESREMALRLIDRYAYSVIFVDALMPNDDAYEICGQIRKHPLQQRATSVLLTSTVSPAERVMGTLAGFDHFLTKPIRRDGINELALELAHSVAAL
jgi:CheY-like chemotaxis protein